MKTVSIKPGMILSFAGGGVLVVRTVYNESILVMKYNSFVGTFVTMVISVYDISSEMFKVIDV